MCWAVKRVSYSKQTVTGNVAQTGEDLQQQGTEGAKGIKPSCSPRKRLPYNNMTAVSNDIPMTVFYTCFDTNPNGARGKATLGDAVLTFGIIIEVDIRGLIKLT